MRQDFLLFRRMRGIFWGVLFAAVVLYPTVVVLGLTIPSQLDLFSERTQQDIGDATNVLQAGLGNLLVSASFAAVLLGATAGSIDQQRGVLRDLVVAGRARWRIALLRMAAAGLWLVLALAVVVAVMTVASIAMAPVSGDVDWGATLVDNGVSALPGLLTTLTFGTGVALLIGSRGIAIGVYFVLSLVVDNVLLALPKVGDWWQHASLSAAEAQVAEAIGRGHEQTFFDATNSTAVAALVLAGWAVVPLLLGLLRFSRRDL